MDWSKAKNLIILLLVIVNVFLLGNISYLFYKNEAAARNTVTELVAFLESRGIALEEDLVPRENLGRTVLVVERSTEEEAALARTLLQDLSLPENAEGNYTNRTGDLSLKSGGYMDARWTEDMTARTLVSRFEKGGVALQETSYTDTAAELLVAYADLPVFNCRITAALENGVWTASGRICMGNALRTDSDYERDVAGLLVGVMQKLVLMDTTEITQIEAGWIAGSISSVGVRLLPVYKLTADSGDYYVNAVDGTLLGVE